jgi:hypothetical protein
VNSIINMVWCPYCGEHIGQPCLTESGRLAKHLHQARLIASGGLICFECGDDLACEGYVLCSECLESS